MAKLQYYTLLERTPNGYHIVYGSDVKADVYQEKADMIADARLHAAPYRKNDLIIIKTAPDQAAIEAEVNRINGNL